MADYGISSLVIAYMAKFFGVSKSRIKSDTFLFESYGRQDPDGFSDFLEAFTARFRIKIHKLQNAAKYFDALNSMEGYHFSHEAILLTKSPVLFVSEITPEELTKVVEKGAWPREYYLAGESIEYSNRRGRLAG